MFPQRPTIFLESRGVTLPMLFDTGTFTSLFIDDGQFLDPGFELMLDSRFIAGVEGKQAQFSADASLSYATLELVKLGGIRLRDVPFRIYSPGPAFNRDYAGAVSAMLFQDFVIQVNNSIAEIQLHNPEQWRPQSPAYVLPLVTLPRGSFVQLEVCGLPYWFHLDTGFSGTIGILPEFLADHPACAVEGQGEPQNFQGWLDQVTGPPLVISEISVSPYGDYSWAAQMTLRFEQVEGVEYSRDYGDVRGLDVGGIVGSGFLARFDYALDFHACRLYLLRQL
jgi:hypothetical protein